MSNSVGLQKHDSSSVIVTLARTPDNTDKGWASAMRSWGLKLAPETMVLLGCIAGSTADRSERARACNGMVLSAANGTPIRRLRDLAAVVVGSTVIRWCFHPAADVPATNEQRRGGSGWMLCHINKLCF